MSFTELEREYLDEQRLGRLATVGPKGDPQNNPVGFVYNAGTGTIEIRGHDLPKTRKYRNVRGNDQVAFVVDDLVSVRPWRVRGIEIRGRAETTVLETAQGGHDIIRIHPRTIFSWGLDPTAGRMTKRVVG